MENFTVSKIFELKSSILKRSDWFSENKTNKTINKHVCGKLAEAAIQRWKYAANLQENNHAAK